MIFHIVKQNETIKDLIFKYGLDKSEIVSNNRHISNWDMLIPGSKLKIPVVNNNLYEHLEEVEPFIEDYYPNDTYDINAPKENESEDNLDDIPNESKDNLDDIPNEPVVEEVTETKDNEKVAINIVPNLPEEQSEPKVSKYIPNDNQYYEHSQSNFDHQQYQESDPAEYHESMKQNFQNKYQNYQNESEYQESNSNMNQNEQVYQQDTFKMAYPNETNYQQATEITYQNNSQVNPYMQVNNSNYPAYYYRMALANQLRNINPYGVIYYDPYRKQYYIIR